MRKKLKIKNNINININTLNSLTFNINEINLSGKTPLPDSQMYSKIEGKVVLRWCKNIIERYQNKSRKTQEGT